MFGKELVVKNKEKKEEKKKFESKFKKKNEPALLDELDKHKRPLQKVIQARGWIPLPTIYDRFHLLYYLIGQDKQIIDWKIIIISFPSAEICVLGCSKNPSHTKVHKQIQDFREKRVFKNYFSYFSMKIYVYIDKENIKI